MNNGPTLFEQTVQSCYSTLIKEPNPTQLALITQYQDRFTGALDLNKELAPLFTYFEVAYSPNLKSFDSALPEIDCLRQRVHISHFFLAHVIPTSRQPQEASKRLLQYLMNDLQRLVASMGTLYSGNLIPAGQATVFVHYLEIYHSLNKSLLPAYQQHPQPNPWPFYRELIQNELSYASILFIHGNRSEAQKHFADAKQHVEAFTKALIAKKTPIKKLKTLKAAAQDLLNETEKRISQEHSIAEQANIRIFLTMVTFEKAFAAELAQFRENLKAPKPANSEYTQSLAAQIAECTDGVGRASKVANIPIMLIELKLKQAVALLSQTDQLFCKEDAAIILPLLFKLSTAWRKFFSNPDILTKQYLEILDNVSAQLLTEHLLLQGINPTRPPKPSWAFCLKRPSPPIQAVTQALATMAIEPPLAPVPNKKIGIPPDVIEVLTKLELAGFKAYVKGGYVRDSLLGIAPNDIDLVTDCPSEQLPSILGALFIKSPFIENHFGNGHMEITCSLLSLKQMATNCDLTINALFANKAGDIYDPLNKIADLDNLFLQTVTKPALSFKKDPKRLLRIISHALHTNKKIPQTTIECMQTLMPTIHTGLPYGVFIKNVIKLFCCGKATLAWDFLDRHQLMRSFLNLAPLASLTGDPEARYFVHTRLQEVDLRYQAQLPSNPYYVLALLLLPELLTRCQNSKGVVVSDVAVKLLDDVCQRNNEKFALTEAERNAFKNETLSMLVHFYCEIISQKLQAMPKTTSEQSKPLVAQYDRGRKTSESFQQTEAFQAEAEPKLRNW